MYLAGLNENLLRIARERANADRKLKPKKEHTGYVVVSSTEKEYRYKINRRDFETATPVSYTHLDVYKRQQLRFGKQCCKVPIPLILRKNRQGGR